MRSSARWVLLMGASFAAQAILALLRAYPRALFALASWLAFGAQLRHRLRDLRGLRVRHG